MNPNDNRTRTDGLENHNAPNNPNDWTQTGSNNRSDWTNSSSEPDEPSWYEFWCSTLIRWFRTIVPPTVWFDEHDDVRYYEGESSVEVQFGVVTSVESNGNGSGTFGARVYDTDEGWHDESYPIAMVLVPSGLDCDRPDRVWPGRPFYHHSFFADRCNSEQLIFWFGINGPPGWTQCSKNKWKGNG